MKIIESDLAFDSSAGIGYLPSESIAYDQNYFDNYVHRGKTTLGVALTSLRCGFVARYVGSTEQLVDIGVGDGSFVRARQEWTLGYDINPVAERMLRSMERWIDVVQSTELASVSFWDALEHIPSPQDIVKKVRRYCFVSIPIFRDEMHIAQSRHFKPGEHFWYFTAAGLIAWFWKLGFTCEEVNDMESILGREDIGTFAFRRR
jgi:hypothetical protein